MTEYCKGCGVLLQNENPEEIGYVPSLDASLCQRCFRIRNYGDVVISMQQGVESNQTFEKINEIDGIVFWIVDLFAFESSIISRLNQKLPNKEIILVLTKRDVLPKTLTDDKIRNFVMDRLKEENIKVKDIIIGGYLLKKGEAADNFLDEVDYMIDKYRNGKDCIFMGVANVGKSTVLNGLLSSNALTTSRNPGTTLDLIPIEREGYTIFDTPGIENKHSALTYLQPKDLKAVIPTKPIRPFVSQIYEDQSFAAGGLARLDLVVKGKASVVGYFSRSISIHRGKLSTADALWQNHLNEMLVPCLDTSLKTMHTYHSTMKGYKKMDVVIHGVGWFCISGDIQDVSVKVHKGIYVSFRKAMI
ncbi:MAG: ribosome biogenesis GTPase YqeH [Holdemanella sp.]|nr:ribosome biogenesis GTPase YqeH [Holdemanella sp.]